MAAVTLLDSIQDKYGGEDEAGQDYGWIVFVSNSPECKKGMFPPIMTLSDYDINTIGNLRNCDHFDLNYSDKLIFFIGHSGIIHRSKLSHIAELDLTDNLLSDWTEIYNLLNMFPGLEFLNLSNNLLGLHSCQSISAALSSVHHTGLRKLVLHGNKLDWSSLNDFTAHLPNLEEIHLSNNGLDDPQGSFGHANLRQLFLTCNHIQNFQAVHDHLGKHCPNLELLSLGENPLTSIPESAGGLDKMISLNLNITKLADWADLDKLRGFPSLSDLRIKHCPVLEEYTAHERRMMLIARLPNIQILNGGDRIPDNEREDAERAFIRFYLDEDSKPKRYHELVAIHGNLDPLVNVNMKPTTHVKVLLLFLKSWNLGYRSSFFTLGQNLSQRRQRPRRSHQCVPNCGTIQSPVESMVQYPHPKYEVVLLRSSISQTCRTRGNEMAKQMSVHLQCSRRRPIHPR